MLTTVVVATLTAVAGPAGPAQAIIDGVEAGKLRGAVQLEMSGNYVCAGVLINPQWVLTAKHCMLEGKPISIWQIRSGDRRRGSGQGSGISNIIRHGTSDIALLKLLTPASAPTVAMVASGWTAGADHPFSGSGWGNTTPGEHSDLAPYLKVCSVKGRTVEFENVSHIFGVRVNGIQSGGDSGGPVSLSDGTLAGILTHTRYDQEFRAVSVGDPDIRSWILLNIVIGGGLG